MSPVASIPSKYESDTVLPPAVEDESSLLHFWLVLRKHRRMIWSLCAGVMAMVLVISLVMPKIYESTTTLLPQLEPREGLGLGSLLAATGAGGAVQGLGMSLPGMPATPADIFVAILKSRVMADEVINRFNLVQEYETKTVQETRKELEDATKIVVTKEKAIKITVEATRPELAADMANFYVSTLDRLNQTLSVSKAGQNRKFIERRLAETQASLVKAEEALKEFQTVNKTVAIEEQAKAMIEAAAMIQAQVTAQEVQLQVMSSYLGTDHPELARVRSSIDELKKQLGIMGSGKSGKGTLPGGQIHPSMASVPGLALEYGRLMRDLKVQETLFTLLTSQYEQAKLTEARDTPTVQVLDPAVPAEKKSKPRILLNMAVAGILSLVLGILFAFYREFKARLAVQQA